MSPLRLILLSLRHFWKTNVAIACGVAVGTAVLTGALLVGDSMRGSLRDLVLAGLGRIDDAIVADHFFREQLAGEGSAARPGGARHTSTSDNRSGGPRPASGCPARPRRSGKPRRLRRPLLATRQRRTGQTSGANEIVLNEPLARLLSVKEGDAVLVALAKPGAIPAEIALGRKRAARWIPSACGSSRSSPLMAWDASACGPINACR